MSADKMKSKKFKIIISLFFLAFLIAAIAGFSMKACSSASDVSIDRKPATDSKKFNILVENWNRSVTNARLDKSYYLPHFDPEGTVKLLNAFIRRFYEFPTPEIMNELKEITEGRQYSFFVFYLRFLEKHRPRDRHDIPLLTVAQSDLETEGVINRLTKEDETNTRALKIIASVDDPCAFLDNFKEELYQDGMSRNIRSCKNIQPDKTKYPNLYKLVNKSSSQ